MQQYLDLVQRVLDSGVRKENRTGVDTLSVFNHNYDIDLTQGFPLLTTKWVCWKNIVIENLWFLSGRTDIGFLHRHGCHFWDAWADERGEVPSAYGHFWRQFPLPGMHTNDQISWVLEELRTNPMSRRMVVSAWAPGNAQSSTLPPCHAMFVLNVQPFATSICSRHRDFDPACSICRAHLSLNLHLTQRSADIALGVPYNIAGYSFLLSLLAHLSGLRVGRFAHSIVDAHAYTSKLDGGMAEHDHVPGLRKQLEREPIGPPTLRISPSIRTLADIGTLIAGADTQTIMDAFQLEGYEPHPRIHFRVAV